MQNPTGTSNPPAYGPEQPQIVVVPGGGGRYLPAYYNGQQILWRTPWVMNGKLASTELPGGNATAFIAIPALALTNTTDKPFEIHDLKISAAKFTGGALAAEPVPGINYFGRLTLRALDVTEELTNADTSFQTMFDIKAVGASPVWPFWMPYTLDARKGFQARVANLMGAGSDMRFEIVFRGSLLVLGPATGGPAIEPRRSL